MREDLCDQSLATGARLFSALMEHDPSVRTLLLAMPEVFPWVRHLREEEVRAFTVELVGALSDAAEPAADVMAQEVVAGWRVTARIKADPSAYREAQAPTTGDFGAVDVVA